MMLMEMIFESVYVGGMLHGFADPGNIIMYCLHFAARV